MGCNIVNLFSNSVAIIKVGAATETELKEKKLRIEDALNATRSALQNATSVAAMFLTTEAVVADIPEKEAPAMPDMGGMGGMGMM